MGESGGASGFPKYIIILNIAKGTTDLVHNCTIFLCSLDVRNIVRGGDPLYAVFFLHRALEAILDQNECVFCKKQLSRV